MNKNKIKKLNFFFTFLLQIVILSSNLFAFYTEKHPEEYLVNIWTVKEGLPQNTIQALLQTNDGFIWIGTPSGLVRFDGLRFKTFTRWDIPVLNNDNITCLFEDENKVLWVGTEGGGLLTFKDGRWDHYSTANGLSSDHIRAILSDFQGDIWVGTDYGLNRISNEGIRIYTEKDGLYDNLITALTMDAWNNLWIGTFRGGLAKYNKGVISVFGYKDGLKNLSIKSLCSDHSGILWIGTYEGIYYIRRDQNIVYQIEETAYTPVNTIIENSENEILIGTMVSGIKRMNTIDFKRKKVTDKLPDEFIRCTIIDNGGNIWLGTDTGGLVQLKVRRIFNLTEEEGLSEKATTAVFQDLSGSIWIGTKNSGLYKLTDNNTSRTYNKSTGLTGNRIRVIYEDINGFLWIGTANAGINILKNSILDSKLTTDSGLSSNHIRAILQDHRGSMWIGTDDGLNTYSNGRFSIYNKSTESNNHVFNVLLESQSKRLYAGTDKGIYQFSDNLIKPLEQNLLANYRVISLYEDGDSTLWIGTDGNGLLRWLNGELEVITKKDGLRDNFILSIDEDEQNNLWMSSHSGVFWIKKNDLVRFFTGKTSRIFSTWYSESEGMVSRQCMGKCQPAVFKTKNNRWLYPTIKGVSILNYNLLTDYCTIPKVCIEYIFCGEDTVSIDNKKSIPELNTETITVAFSATEFSAPEKIRFKYILEGYDENFLYLDSGVDRVATYHNLPYGDYRFHLLAANNELRWSEEATTIEFRINPPFYLSPSFLIIVITVTLSFSSVLIYQHHKRKKTQKVDKYKTSPLDSTKIEELLTKLETIMTEEKLFLNPDLTLGHLARRLKIHSNYISRIINEQFDMSYNDYINRYRVEEVKNRFSNPDFSDKTVLEIMYDTGFYSKSVFNMAFKKFTGMTPTEYRKKTN